MGHSAYWQGSVILIVTYAMCYAKCLYTLYLYCHYTECLY